MESPAVSTPSVIAPASSRGEVTVVVLAPRWRLGRRAAARRSVEAAFDHWKRRVGRVFVAAQPAVAAALRAGTGDSLVIVPDSETALSSVACLIDACPGEPLLILEPETELPDAALDRMLAALEDEQAAAVAVVHPEKRLLPFPLLVKRAVHPLLEALLAAGASDVADLMRRPAARLVLL